MSKIVRRDFLRTLSAGAAAAAIPGLTGCGPASDSSARRPNIIIMMADDMGFSDIGCYGGEIDTPNLNRLAQHGIRFTQFYNTARCCPTRASLLTGLYQHQAGVGHMVQDRGVPAYQGYLNDRCVTIAEALKPAGYTTLMSGKWHVGEDRPHWPVDRGFEEHFGLISGASNFWRLDEGRTMAVNGEPYTPPTDGFYMTDAFTDHACDMIGRHAGREKPFFLYLAFTAPHWPLHAHPQDIEKYRGRYMMGWDELRRQRHQRMIELGIVKPNWPLTPRDQTAPAWETVADKEARDLKMAVYAAQIDNMDQNIGRVLAKLDEAGAADNTLILFLADNGGCAEEINRSAVPDTPPGPADSYLSYGLPWANASNTPFRLYKHWVHEGGIATPLIAHWPAGVKPELHNTLTDAPGHVIDLMATCVDLAEAEYPAEHNGQPVTPLEGKSLSPVFRTGNREPHEAIYWEHEGNRAIRLGKWKLVSKWNEGNEWQLYDLDADRTEMNDLAAVDTAKRDELAAMWHAWADRAGVVPWDQFQRRRG